MQEMSIIIPSFIILVVRQIMNLHPVKGSKVIFP